MEIINERISVAKSISSKRQNQTAIIHHEAPIDCKEKLLYAPPMKSSLKVVLIAKRIAKEAMRDGALTRRRAYS